LIYYQHEGALSSGDLKIKFEKVPCGDLSNWELEFR